MSCFKNIYILEKIFSAKLRFLIKRSYQTFALIGYRYFLACLITVHRPPYQISVTNQRRRTEGLDSIGVICIYYIYSAPRLAELKEAFSLFDKNGDGSISTKELGTVMRSMGENPTELELQALVNEADVDCDGKIDLEEFVTLMCQRGARADNDENIREAFRAFDITGAGYICADELRSVMHLVDSGLSALELDEIMSIADPHKHGRVTYDHDLTSDADENRQSSPSWSPTRSSSSSQQHQRQKSQSGNNNVDDNAARVRIQFCDKCDLVYCVLSAALLCLIAYLFVFAIW